MTWYQSEQQQNEWRKLIEKSNPKITQLMDSEEFYTQLIKNGNVEIMAWVEDNYKYFYEELLTRCLVLPLEGDGDDRKFKEPTQAINLICNSLDSMAVPSSGLPTSSISGSMACSMMGTGGKVTSPEIISFIVEKMFCLYMQNNAEKLYNTLIPGYFNRIFDSLNRSHSPILIQTLRTSQHTKLQKLLESHGKFQQIIKCIQTVLIVFINQTSQCTNLQMSVTFPNSPAPTVLPHPAPLAAGNLQPNYPFDIKHKLLMNILNKIHNYRKVQPEFLENLISVVLEIMRNVHVIFEGNHLGDYVCQFDNTSIFFAIGLGALREEGKECQIKCLELLKYCFHIMSPVDRSNLIPKLKQVTETILRASKPTILLFSMLQLLNQWYLVESSQPSTLFTNSNISMQRSLSSSLSNSSLRVSNVGTTGISTELQELLCTGNLFQKLLKLCVSSPDCNIFQRSVSKFIQSIFKSQNAALIINIFKQNEIIKETTTKINNFKQNSYCGHFLQIIKVYTTRRIDTPDVNQAIDANKAIWEKFYLDFLEPHAQKWINKLGQMEGVNDPEVLQFTSIKKQQSKKIIQECKNEKQPEKKVQKPCEAESAFKPIQLNYEINQIKKEKKTEPESEAIEPISLQFMKKESENKQEKQSESFQSFLKKKMGESNKQVDQRRKSRTPTKIISGQSKKKKWGAENDNQKGPESAKKSVSADQKAVKPIIKPQQILPKLLLLRLSTRGGRPCKPKVTKERKVNKQNDENLLKWLERARSNVKMVR